MTNDHTFLVEEPFSVAYRNNSTMDPVGPHIHNNVSEFYLTLSDLPDVILNDRVFEVPSHTLIVIPQFCVHQLYHEKDTVYERYVINVDDRWLNAALNDSGETFSYLGSGSDPFLIALDPKSEKELSMYFDKLIDCLKPTPRNLSTFFEMMEKFDEIVRKNRKEAPEDYMTSKSQAFVSDVISYINAHIQENLTVSGLSEHFFLNPDYFSRLFKKHAHVSVSQYITMQKISTAQTLLRSGMTVAQVQEKLGYSSYAYFFKTFQKNTGISPSKYKTHYNSVKSEQ